MNILITIAARAGSKGVKNKNIREVNGKPLISYSIETAKNWGKATKIVCSTDSQKIAEIARKYGAEIPFIRDSSLATSTIGKMDVIRDTLIRCEKIYNMKFDLIVDLDVTAPIRTPKDLDCCLKTFLNKKPEVLFSVVPARRSPYFNMVEFKDDNFVKLASNIKEPIKRRQDAPEAFDMNASIYFYDREFLLNKKNTSVTFAEKASIYIMDEISSFDIDNELDLKIVEFLMKQKEVIL